MNINFHKKALNDLFDWATQDQKTLKRIKLLINDINRNGYSGIGKPEPLTGDLSGWWSVRIDGCNRLIFQIANGELIVASCRGHYGDT